MRTVLRASLMVLCQIVVTVVIVSALVENPADADPLTPVTGPGCGDVNGDGSTDIGDPIYLLSYLFSGGPDPVCAGGPFLDADQVALLCQILPHISVENGPAGEATTIRFTGVNLQIVNGLEATNGHPGDPASFDPALTSVNGLGNLIVGYNEPHPSSPEQTGSHNIVAGTHNNYASFGGVVTGWQNSIAGMWSSVTGGHQNTASGLYASISGGRLNQASGESASISGGHQNVATGSRSSVSGGYVGLASGHYASIGGGQHNTASGDWSSVSGGGHALPTDGNVASGTLSSISGGARNEASGDRSSISGGEAGSASGVYSSILGGENNIADAYNAAVSGGYGNAATGIRASVSGGQDVIAAGDTSWAVSCSTCP